MKSRLLVPIVALLLAAVASPVPEARILDRSFTVPAGTLLRVRLQNSLGSDVSRIEDPVRGQLVDSIVVDGKAVVPAGSAVLGSVTQAVRSGKVKGRARLGLRFHTLTPLHDDDRYRIATRSWTSIAPATKKKDAAEIGIPAAGGAIIGGLIGGKKGAAIGGAAGGGAGAAVVLTTRGKEVRLPRGSVVAVRLTAPVTLYTR